MFSMTLIENSRKKPKGSLTRTRDLFVSLVSICMETFPAPRGGFTIGERMAFERWLLFFRLQTLKLASAW